MRTVVVRPSTLQLTSADSPAFSFAGRFQQMSLPLHSPPAAVSCSPSRSLSSSSESLALLSSLSLSSSLSLAPFRSSPSCGVWVWVRMPIVHV